MIYQKGMFYARAALINLWLFISCLIGLLISPFRWKDPDLNHDIARIFSWLALRIAGIKLILEGSEHLESHQPCVYVANHQSGLDVATFGGILPHKTLAIGKKELLWIPFFGQYFWASGNIIINRQDRKHSVAGLGKAVEAIQQRQISVFIFPEGTRNRTDDVLLPFKKGAFYMAIDAQVPIVPIVKTRHRDVKPGTLKIRVLPAIETRGMTKADVDRLSALTRERMIEAILGLD